MLRTVTQSNGRSAIPVLSLRRYNSSKVTEIASLQQFDNVIGKKEKLSIVDFYATWCGPCKAVSPIFDRMAQAIPEVEFARVDVDKAADIAMKYEVKAMPTFLLFQNGKKVEAIVGADIKRITLSIEKYSGVDFSKKG